jgi:hypothetical protein
MVREMSACDATRPARISRIRSNVLCSKMLGMNSPL